MLFGESLPTLLKRFKQESISIPYDYIIADINLEEKNGSKLGGLDLLEYIVKNNIETKVVIITAHSGMIYQDSFGNQKGVLDRAMKLGAFACLSRTKGRNYLDELVIFEKD